MKAHNFTNKSAITERIIVHRMMEYDLFSTPTLVAVTAVCSLLFLVGVPGNLCTVLVIARSTEMRTTTNYYLASLACADLLTFFILPLELYRLWCYWDWELGDAVCRGMYFLRETFTAASILHISGFTVERYIAICHPLQAKRLLRRGRVKVLIAAAWVLAVVPASPALLIFGVTRIQTPRGFECGVVNKELGSVMSLVSTSFFFVPMILLSLLYGLMAWALTDRGHSRFYRGSTEQTEGSRRQDNNRRKVIRMLAVIVLTFVILWLPHHVSRVTFNHVRTWTTQLYQVHNIVTLLSFVLFYLSSAVNPIIYNMMSQRFRYALKHFLCGRDWLRGAQLSSKSSFRTRLSAISRGQSGSDGGGEEEKARDEPQMIAMVEIIGDNADQCDL
ncbi:PREDICTED: growth hormone secretagogue receptor type 1-like [Branchiostoma belcheri]|uniref:Growth hormone secretagogue receptor type 1-like n=1 Tax=Branchiostoma belcheri TaxID=7741 RepID=A0A6P4ZRT8_BRABE|nr:PREDICTED: growth hormone secretagogue receptor type 1-like [Branchiostoma belcheri]